MTSSGTRTTSGNPGRSTVSGLNRSKKPVACSSWLAAPRAAVAMTTPLPVSGANRNHDGSKATTARSAAPGDRVVGGAGAQQLFAQCSGPHQRQPVEVDAVLVAGRGGAGADPRLGQPEQRWMGEEVRSTVRTRSTGVESTCRLSSPRRSSIRPPLIRKLVVR